MLKNGKGRRFFCGFKVCTRTRWFFTVWLRWPSNSQNNHTIRSATCCNNKKGMFREKKLRFGPKKRLKNGFLAVLKSALKHFGNLLCHKDAQTHKITTPMEAQGVETFKKRQLYSCANCVSRQNFTKKGFLGFSDIEPVKPLVILLQCSDNAQIYKIAGHFNLDGGKLKIEAQNIILFFFYFCQFFKVSTGWFWLRILSTHFPLSYFYSTASIALKLTA